MGHRAVASWAEESLGHSGIAFIALVPELHPWRTGQTAGDASRASNGIMGAGGWRGGCVGAAPRGQGQVIRVTPGPRLSLWSGLDRRRCRCGEEDDTVAGVADTWGQVGSDSRRSRKARGREQRVGLASGARCYRAQARRACWAGCCCVLASQAGRAGCGPSPFLSFFYFYFSSPLFEFKFDFLEFEFKVGVPYSLEF